MTRMSGRRHRLNWAYWAGLSDGCSRAGFCCNGYAEFCGVDRQRGVAAGQLSARAGGDAIRQGAD